MEIKVKDAIQDNLETLYKLDRAGIKNISTAIDYLSIWEEYQKYTWIASIEERKAVVADKCKVGVKSVERALALMSRAL